MSADTEEKAPSPTREALASAWTRREEMKPGRLVALAAGLQWLLRTEQPKGAICQHHGVVIHTRGNRYFSFMPGNSEGRATVAISIHKVERDMRTLELHNPLERNEMATLERDLTEMGVRVVDTWNGDGCDSGSLALAQPISPSLVAAVDLYRAGCQQHPSRNVFCDCGWFRRGADLLVLPKLPDGRV